MSSTPGRATHAELAAATRHELDRMVAVAQHDWHTPGVSAGVVRDGQLIWSSHIGTARLEPGAESPTDDTTYMIGSVTKTFTAVLVMALRDEGKLALDDPLGTYLPDTRHGAITLRQMLAHASGLQREPVGRIWESLDAPDEEQLLRGLEEAERVLPAHFAFHYSNLAYALLGQVVERVDRRAWEESVTERILLPLGMTRTSLTPDEATRAQGFFVHPRSGIAVQEPRFVLNASAPLGGLWSTVADMSRYAAFVADPVDDVLRPDTVDEMCRPLIMTDLDGWARAYGLGYDLQRIGERVMVGHGGAMPGYLTGLRVRRADKIGAIVFNNSTAGADPVGLSGRLVAAVLDAAPSVPEAWTPSRPQPGLEGILGSWWSEGDEIVLEVRDNELWSRLPSAPSPLAETRFAAEGADRFRAVGGRERGELLEVTRDERGVVTRLHFATYALTREPTAFADLLG